MFAYSSREVYKKFGRPRNKTLKSDVFFTSDMATSIKILLRIGISLHNVHDTSDAGLIGDRIIASNSSSQASLTCSTVLYPMQFSHILLRIAPFAGAAAD